ncbi:GIY-YIG nuclease family protein [Endozoicomonas sp. Mp262]|uniref:GIY-YIG nuclease family protein n=1 Tax=Endozoicomonas sp. Mp262 TaxID=2919499 RepID=UPI0021D8B562
MNWLVYMILASDNSIYTGITTNIERRWRQHLTGMGGAKYFRSRDPKWLIYLEHNHNRSSALRREMTIKKMTKEQKWLQIDNKNNQVHTLSINLPVWRGNPHT